MKIRIYADGADLGTILELNKNPIISGFTTNPTLLRKAGVADYEVFAKSVLSEVGKPISFEVFADEFDEMIRQARIISSWGDSVFVKIPITNTQSQSSMGVVDTLGQEGIKLNITAVTTREQIDEIAETLMYSEAPVIVSIFAGRIADTGVNPVPIIAYARHVLPARAEVLWASPREVLNIYQAEEAGADIITCTPDLIKKYEQLKGKDLAEFSLDTVKMFFDDGQAAGYKL